MFDRSIVQKALNRTRELNNSPGLIADNPADDQSSVISHVIFDVFGGEILKTHKKKGWHFYNRIDGQRMDFTRPEIGKFSGDYRFEDIHSTPDETNIYYAQEEYFTFFANFINQFEEAVGLNNYKSVSTV